MTLSRQPAALDPQMADLLRRIERTERVPYWQMGLAGAREWYDRAATVLDIPLQAVGRVQELSIPMSDGYPLYARLITPQPLLEAGQPTPLVIYAHGGGFTLGSPDTVEPICRMLANRVGCQVLNLKYRLAPEYPFPTAAEDVWQAWDWAFRHAQGLMVDPQRVVGMGDSAGGTLTLQAAIRARDSGLPLLGQVLIYPGATAWQDTPSHHTYGQGYLIDQRTIQWFFEQYVPLDSQRLDWRFAPLECPDFRGLCPSLLQLAECDPLIDEGMQLSHRLQADGVITDTRVYAGMVHAFYNMGGALRVARQAHTETVQVLRDWFGVHADPQTPT